MNRSETWLENRIKPNRRIIIKASQAGSRKKKILEKSENGYKEPGATPAPLLHADDSAARQLGATPLAPNVTQPKPTSRRLELRIMGTSVPQPTTPCIRRRCQRVVQNLLRALSSLSSSTPQYGKMHHVPVIE